MKIYEAKTKWCPMVRRVTAYDAGGERKFAVTNSGSNCVDSNCMMWRWNKKETDGYCGLAGEEK